MSEVADEIQTVCDEVQRLYVAQQDKLSQLQQTLKTQKQTIDFLTEEMPSTSLLSVNSLDLDILSPEQRSEYLSLNRELTEITALLQSTSASEKSGNGLTIARKNRQMV